MKRELLFVFLCLSGPVIGEMVTYEFSGTIDTITNVNNAFPEGTVGQSFSGWFSYSKDSRSTEIGSIVFSIGSYNSTLIDKKLLILGGSTSCFFSYYDTHGIYDFGRTGLTFKDASGQIFANTSQLPASLAMSMFDKVEFDIQGTTTNNGVYIGAFDLKGHLNTLSPAPTPEPATLLLMLAGGLFCRHRTR